MQTNPSNDINTLRDLEARIDAYRGQITLQEQSISQNLKLLASQEYTIGQNELRIKELNEFVENAEKAQTDIVADTTAKTEALDTLNSNIETANDTLTSIMTEIKTQAETHDAITEALEKASESMADREADVTKREKDVGDKEDELSKKHAQIKSFAEKL